MKISFVNNNRKILQSAAVFLKREHKYFIVYGRENEYYDLQMNEVETQPSTNTGRKKH